MAPSHSRTLSFLLAALALFFPARGQAATTSMTLQIPARPADPASPIEILPVAAVRLTLETNGPVAGSTVTLGGQNLTVPMGTTVVAGDFVKVTALGNTVEILLNPISMLGPNQPFCNLKSGQPDKNYNISFVGPQVTGYRLTSYAANSTVQCSCANRRLKPGLVAHKQNAAFFTAPPTTDVGPPPDNLGRHPLDIVLVLDRSGSMSDTTVGDPLQESKWTVMKWSAQQFISALQTEVSPLPSGGSISPADRLALVLFSSDPEKVFFPSASATFFVPRGASWEDIKTELDLPARSPSGSTALGGGLKEAINALTANPLNDRLVVLMTDGMQNRDPMVTTGPPEAPFKMLSLDGGTPTPIKDPCIPVLTVALGDVASTEVDLLDRIAIETAGRSGRETSTQRLDLAFMDRLVEALQGNSLSIAERSIATLEPGKFRSAGLPVELDGTVHRAIVVLGWRGGQATQGNVDLEAQQPDGGTATPVQIIRGRDYTVQAFDIPRSGPAGQWSFVVVRAGHELVDPSLSIPYHLSVYTVEKELGFDSRFTGARHGTGDPLILETQVIFESKGLANLGDDLQVLVEGPGAGLGNLLHDRKGLGGAPPDPQQADVLSPYQKKIQNLLAQDPTFREQSTARSQGNRQTLTPAGDGLYTFTLGDTRVPGTYRVHIFLDTKTSSGAILRRFQTIETVVEVIPDGPSSVIQSQSTGGGQFVLTLVPRDQFGNFVGPGHDDQVTVRTGGIGKLVGITDTDLDGTYQVQLSGLTDDTPIEVFVANTLIARGPVSKLEPVPRQPPEGPKPPPKHCAHCGATGGDVLLLLALPILILLSRRRARRL